MLTKVLKIIPLLFILLSCTTKQDLLRRNFVTPPLSLKSRPLWFWNRPLSREQTLKVMKASKEAGYYGLGIVPSYGMTPEFMTPGFLAEYKMAVEIADSLGMKLYLYDEFYFPSGMAGGQLYKQYPEAVSKRLDMELTGVRGPKSINQPIPAGVFMGAVGMENSTMKRIDLSGEVSNNRLATRLPAGDWKVMIFTVNPDSSSGRFHCDYLSPEAVGRFIELTYEKYYQAFPEHFGTTIDYAFYDEPCLRWVEGGRTWTEKFNDKFAAKYGFSPVLLYPSLWFDIGPETESARNALLGFRADLYATGFPKTINDWCREHGIQLTGHVDQEEIVNPVAICGDLMKAFKYQDIPAVDEIFWYGRSSYIYKVISSAANNYDRPIVATECYGATGKFTAHNLYKEAMDQFAKGINLMEPHAVWYTEAVDIQPDLSPASAKFGADLPKFNEYIGRLQGMLQGGQHVADIGILYPIASLQGAYHFGPGDPGMGGIIPGEADYLDIGEMLSLEVRRDFTYLHPEIFDEKCIVQEGKIRLNNRINPEEYRVMIIPGSKTILLTNLIKIKSLYDQGGVVIATSQLPEHSAEAGRDGDVQRLIKSMFGDDCYESPGVAGLSASSCWNTAGFIPANSVDGKLETAWKPSQGNLKGEYLELIFDHARQVSKVKIRGTGDRAFGFRVFCRKVDQWVECGKWEGHGEDKTVSFTAVLAAGIRIALETGEPGKVTVPEIEIMDPDNINIVSLLKSYTLKTNSRGGKAIFISLPNAAILKSVLDETDWVWDTRFEKEVKVTGGNLTYIHKRLNGRNIWFFANSSDSAVEVPVTLKGTFALESWNPHNGQILPLESVTSGSGGTKITRGLLTLGSEESVFWVEK